MASKKNKKRKRPATPSNHPAAQAASTATDPKKGYTAPKGAATAKRGRRDDQPQRPTRQGRARRLSPTASWTLLGVGIVAIVGAVVAFSVAGSGGGGSGVTDAEAWDLPALQDDLDDDGDGRVRLADFEGTPTVVNFFASWCVECDRELPEYTAVAKALEGDVDFVFVNSNETGNWRPMADDHGLRDDGFPLAADVGGTNRNGLIRSLGGSTGMPATAFYDADGNLVDVSLGALVNGALQQRLLQTGLATPEQFA